MIKELKRKYYKRMNICWEADWSFKKNKRMAVMFNTAQVSGDPLHQGFLDNAKKARKIYNENKFWYMKSI